MAKALVHQSFPTSVACAQHAVAGSLLGISRTKRAADVPDPHRAVSGLNEWSESWPRQMALSEERYSGPSIQSEKRAPQPAAASALDLQAPRTLGLPKRNGTGQRSRTRPNATAVVTALHDPLTVLLTDNFSYLVRPNDDSAYRGAASAYSVVSP
jgi:hypothetical protein